MIRLGINIDHVATIRNARGASYPDPVRAAKIAEEARADGITAHLREDRRHIKDEDIFRLKQELNIPLNFEMAATDEMIGIANKVLPHAVCLVPEKREELTTEGGLNVKGNFDFIKKQISKIKEARVSLFVDPEIEQLESAKAAGTPVVEIHTGAYCEAFYEQGDVEGELKRIQTAAKYAEEIGLECHAGHGLTYDTVKPIAAIPNIVELNIGHFLIGESVFLGLGEAIKKMRKLMDDTRN